MLRWLVEFDGHVPAAADESPVGCERNAVDGTAVSTKLELKGKGSGVPHAHAAVPTARCRSSAVLGEHTACDAAPMALQLPEQCARLIPNV